MLHPLISVASWVFFLLKHLGVFDTSSDSPNRVWYFRIFFFFVHYDVFFSSVGNPQLSIQNETWKADKKLHMGNLLAPGLHSWVAGRSFSRSPKVSVFLLGKFVFSGKESIHSYVPTSLKRSKKRNPKSTSYQSFPTLLNPLAFHPSFCHLCVFHFQVFIGQFL
jgi:hypothetical protein